MHHSFQAVLNKSLPGKTTILECSSYRELSILYLHGCGHANATFCTDCAQQAEALNGALSWSVSHSQCNTAISERACGLLVRFNTV